jgi:hypothetical protein
VTRPSSGDVHSVHRTDGKWHSGDKDLKVSGGGAWLPAFPRRPKNCSRADGPEGGSWPPCSARRL